MSARGLDLVWRAFADALSKISRANGYWHDLGGRIVTRFELPTQGGSKQLPYLCLPVEDGGSYPETSPGLIQLDYQQPIYVFLAENEARDLDSCAAVDLLRWHDDVVRALTESSSCGAWDLGSSVIDNVEIVSRNMYSEPINGWPAHLRILAVARTCYSRDCLGPASRNQ